MTTTTTDSIAYERPADHAAAETPDRNEAACPGILRAAAILFFANFLIACAIWLSPELRVGVYGAEDRERVSLYKPSPFTEVVETSRPRQARAAAKARPVLFEEPQSSDEAAAFTLSGSVTGQNGAPQEVAMSEAAPRPATLTGSSVSRVVESYSDFPRVTAALHRPVSENLVHSATVDIAPRRVSEHVVRTALN